MRALAGGEDHRAVMPLALAWRCIEITSRKHDVVPDPYASSGTTLLAARELGRKWVGIELNPSCVDLIERRVVGRVGRGVHSSRGCRSEET